ncbi:hypothetical protein CRE_13038 [Caenorhabditis remanei]|uniref:Uncharacterized protein n=1 Tax=Caenorhabditis remanei TaxID=31234 RepID=E3N7E7_CAERE|nr:hypothetical protein CRE_13038 [Caenorhabditis remanei]
MAIIIPVKLLHMPSIPLNKVLRHFSVLELFEFSQCSQKAAAAIKLIGTKNFKLELNFNLSYVRINDDFKFEVKKLRADEVENVTGFRTFEKNQNMIYMDSRNKITCLWEDRFARLRTIFSHLSKLFGCPTYSVRSDASVPTHAFLLVMHEIISRQSEINVLEIACKSLQENNVKWILEKLTVTDELMLGEKLSEDFGKNNSIHFVAKSLFIFNAKWVTPQKLLSMRNCVAIELDGSLLTDQDIINFFENWKSGQYPNLEFLSIKSEQLTRDLVLPGALRMERDFGWCQPKIICGKQRYIHCDFQIFAHNGTIGSVQLDKLARDVQFMVS